MGVCYRTVDGDKVGYDTIVRELLEKLAISGIGNE